MIVMSCETSGVSLVSEEIDESGAEEGTIIPGESLEVDTSETGEEGSIIPEESPDATPPDETRDVKLDSIDDRLRGRQELARTVSMFFLLSILFFCVIWISKFVGKITSVENPEELKENISVSVQLITLVWTSIVTLVSGGLAFYFGSRS
jgi:hypothetical protein